MKVLIAMILISACSLAVAVVTTQPVAITADRIDSAIERFGRTRAKMSVRGNKEVVEQIDRMVSELHQAKAMIPPGGVLRPPSEEDACRTLEAFKTNEVYRTLPPEQRQQLQSAIVELKANGAKRSLKGGRGKEEVR